MEDPSRNTAPEETPARRVAALARQRAETWSFLADGLSRPALAGGEEPEDLAGRWARHVAPYAHDLASAAARRLEFPEAAAALKAEFSRLFVVPTGAWLAPYESVHRGPGDGSRSRLRGRPWFLVRDRYRAEGFEPDHPEADHISCELRFPAFLCEREAVAWAAGDESEAWRLRGEQREFLASHPAGWIDRLGTQMETVDAEPYYRHLVAATRAFVEVELAHLAAGVRPDRAGARR